MITALEMDQVEFEHLRGMIDEVEKTDAALAARIRVFVMQRIYNGHHASRVHNHKPHKFSRHDCGCIRTANCKSM